MCSSDLDHRVFHTVSGFHALGDGVGIGYGEFGIRLDRMGHGLGGEFAVDAIGLFTVEAHAHHFFPLYVDRQGVPDEFAAAGPGEVPHIVGLEDPGLPFFAFLAFGFFGFFQGGYFKGFFCRLCFLLAGELCRR